MTCNGYACRRGLGVGIVYLLFVATVVVALFLVATVVVDQGRTAADRVDAYVTEKNGATGQTRAEVDIERLQGLARRPRFRVDPGPQQTHRLVGPLKAKDISGYTNDVFSFAKRRRAQALVFLFSVVLIVVISIYMLLDCERLEPSIDGRFPPHGGLPDAADRAGACGLREGSG